MLRDRSPPADVGTTPRPAELGRSLDDREPVALVRAGLARRRPATPSRGRPSTPAAAVRRMLVATRLSGWTYAAGGRRARPP